MTSSFPSKRDESPRGMDKANMNGGINFPEQNSSPFYFTCIDSPYTLQKVQWQFQGMSALPKAQGLGLGLKLPHCDFIFPV